VLKTIYACFDDLGKGLDVPLCQQQCQRELALLARLQDSLCSLTAACWDIHLAIVLAWDAVGAQIEPYLVQHAEWQRPCGVALGCCSLT